MKQPAKGQNFQNLDKILKKFIYFNKYGRNKLKKFKFLFNYYAGMEKIFYFLGPLKILKKIYARKLKKYNIIEYGNCNYKMNHQCSNQLIAVGSC